MGQSSYGDLALALVQPQDVWGALREAAECDDDRGMLRALAPRFKPLPPDCLIDLVAGGLSCGDMPSEACFQMNLLQINELIME